MTVVNFSNSGSSNLSYTGEFKAVLNSLELVDRGGDTQNPGLDKSGKTFVMLDANFVYKVGENVVEKNTRFMLPYGLWAKKEDELAKHEMVENILRLGGYDTASFKKGADIGLDLANFAGKHCTIHIGIDTDYKTYEIKTYKDAKTGKTKASYGIIRVFASTEGVTWGEPEEAREKAAQAHVKALAEQPGFTGNAPVKTVI